MFSDARSRTEARFRALSRAVIPEGGSFPPVSTPITTTMAREFYCGLAAGVSNFFVTWPDNGPGSGANIFSFRLNSAGLPIETDPTLLSGSADQQDTPAVAFNGSSYLVVWQDARNQTTSGSDIYGVRIRPDGVVEDPMGISICIQPRDQGRPAVAANGTDFLVVWEDRRN